MKEPYDLIVIGGGINGTAVARDAALRGLNTVLFEKRDFGWATTGNSSGMIHGGLRYLTVEPSLTKRCCTDAGYIRKIAHHLMFRIPFLYVLKKGKSNILAHLIDGFFSAYDIFQPLKGGKNHVRLTSEEIHYLVPTLSQEVEGGFSFDEWGVNTYRLTILNAIGAKEAGAKLYTYHEVIELIRDEDKVVGVKVKDLFSGMIKNVYGKVVINTTGPWSPIIGEKAQVKIKLRPSKGIHLILSHRITNYGIITEAIDGRLIFIEPWDRFTLIGTTDDDYYGELDDIPVLWDEVHYLLQSMETVFPGISSYRIIDTWAGVRPTLYKFGINEDDLSRDHKILDHSKEGAKGFFSLIGGKLAEFRVMAEEAVDKIVGYLNVSAKCKTHEVPLPGGEREISIKNLPDYYGVSLHVIKSMYRRYGCRIENILDLVFEDPRLRGVVCECREIIGGELKYAIEEEGAKNLEDLMRRTSLGTGACGGVRCAQKAAQFIGDYLGWDYKRIDEEVISFIRSRWKRRKIIAITLPQIKRELLNQIYMRSFLEDR